jgi:putative cardiolipin synthase
MSRRGTLSQVAEMVGSFSRINHRMHNKTWIADNRIAVVGGRNVGDEYFGASEDVNFVDLDFALVGPIVRDASASFDTYWNASTTWPMGALDPNAVNDEALARIRALVAEHAATAEQSPHAAELRGGDAVKRLVAGDWPMEWTDGYRFVSDDPEKVTRDVREPSHVRALLVPTAERARDSISLISPYFVPGERGTRILTDAARAGKRVRVLTNSLVANDVAAVHGGYARWRRPLLEGGVDLWELKPLSGDDTPVSLLGSRGASLHTKALAVDGRALFVGSYNIDPRSAWLNCEQGVLAENAPLAEQLDAIFDRQTRGARAWRVTLEKGDLRWSDGQETFESDPRAPAGRRLQAWLTRVFRLDAQL